MKYRKPFLFDCFSPDCGTALITAVAKALSAGLSADQMNVLGAFLTSVADIILYNAAQIEFNENTCPKPPGSKEDSEGDEFLPDETGDGAEAGAAEKEKPQEDNPSKQKTAVAPPQYDDNPESKCNIETYNEGC